MTEKTVCQLYKTLEIQILWAILQISERLREPAKQVQMGITLANDYLVRTDEVIR